MWITADLKPVAEVELGGGVIGGSQADHGKCIRGLIEEPIYKSGCDSPSSVVPQNIEMPKLANSRMGGVRIAVYPTHGAQSRAMEGPQELLPGAGESVRADSPFNQ